MPVDAGPHATPDQIRAAEKRAAAARTGAGDVEPEAAESAARATPPKGRRGKPTDES